MSLSFDQIRPTGDGNRLSFEELVCQLARRAPPKDAAEFRRVEGSGGDGGVEAYWILQNGKKIGYQAKYFLRTKDIDWSQIDKSVGQALATHPELIEYQVVLACDLTDRSGAKGRGKTGFGHWDTHKANWDRIADKAGVNVRFVNVTASNLVDTITHPNNAGLLSYWFERPFIDAGWFEDHHEVVVANLDERYHPEDHVDISLRDELFALSRAEQFWSNFRAKAKSALDIETLEDYLKLVESGKIKNLGASCVSIVSEIMSAADKICDAASYDKIDLSSLVSACGLLKEQINVLSNAIRTEIDEIEDSYERRQSPCWGMYEHTGNLESRVRGLLGWLQSGSQLKIDQRRCMLLTGQPGIGKSHLLADHIAGTLASGKPSLMLLGQHIGGDLEQSFLNRIGLSGFGFDQALQALDCAAEASRQRCVIAIDAINESHDLRIWRPQISGFLTKLLRYQNLSCVLSSRPEYVARLLPNGVLQQLVQIEHNGFTTIEEQEEAAVVYMERRGITRPSVPLLNPEFTNPLFLRTVTTAMKRAGETIFPRGLQGSTAIMEFYLERLEQHLLAEFPADGLPSNCLRRLVNAVVSRMLIDLRIDCVSRQTIEQEIEATFGSRASSDGKPWLETLTSEGLFRKDHVFPGVSDTGFTVPTEVYRFSYQRFFDLFVVHAAISKFERSEEIFAMGTPFSDLLSDDHWMEFAARFYDALAVAIPEKFDGAELLDVLSAADERIKRSVMALRAFEQSLRWRDASAFSDRTFELFDELTQPYYDPRYTILIEMTCIPDHPLNAKLLHEHLNTVSMNDRDGFWSIKLANICDDDEFGQAVRTLIHWSLYADKSYADNSTLELCANTLAWIFSTSNRPLRDRTTKALSVVLEERPRIAIGLINRFCDVDDLYVLERVLAAIYGVCCRGIEAKTHLEICELVWSRIFANNTPPLHLLLRDYASGILECALHKGILPSDIQQTVWRPPYQSDWVADSVSKEELKAIAKKAGGTEILFSADGHGDFGNYSVPTRIREFTNVPLSEERPETTAEKRERFLSQIQYWPQSKQDAFAQLDADFSKYRSAKFSAALLIRIIKANAKSDIDEDQKARAAEKIEPPDELRTAFEALLTQAELEQFQHDCVPSLYEGTSSSLPQFDPVFARRWIAKRAYDLGWTKVQFEREPSDFNGRERPRFERIGKKYQWLALHELLARLADNRWYGGYAETARKYQQATDVSFIRDIDPTIVPPQEDYVGDGRGWWTGYHVDFEEVSKAEIASWPFGSQDLPSPSELIRLTDPAGDVWLDLKSIASFDERYDEPQGIMPYRRSCFARTSAIIVPTSKLSGVIAQLADTLLVDPSDWEHVSLVDSGYYGEHPWRAPWKENWSGFQRGQINAVPELEIIRPVVECQWEHHLDLSLSEGYLTAMPSPWLAAALELKPDHTEFGAFVDKDGRSLFKDVRAQMRHSPVALVRETEFIETLNERKVACIWVVAGEKTAAPDGSRDQFAMHQFTMLCTCASGRIDVQSTATKDYRRGLMIYDPSLTDELPD